MEIGRAGCIHFMQEDREMTIECGKRQGRWEKYETEREKQERDRPQSSEKAVAQRQQIFGDSKCAFLMLSKELLDLFKQQVGRRACFWAALV
eukprot:998317-Pelagomonas_calceolata.AAC.5